MKINIKEAFRRFLKNNPSKLQAKALKRASQIHPPKAGTPHDWEDYEKYLEEEARSNGSLNKES